MCIGTLGGGLGSSRSEYRTQTAERRDGRRLLHGRCRDRRHGGQGRLVALRGGTFRRDDRAGHGACRQGEDRGRRREDRPGGRSRARRGGIRAAGDACGRRRARRFAERGALRFAEPAPAGDRRRGDGSGRDGEGQTLFRLSRRDARRLPAFHARGGCEGLHRHSGHA